MIRALLTLYYRWKFRNIDPDVCCCGGQYNARGCCDNHSFTSAKDYAIAGSVDRLTTWKGWADRIIYSARRGRLQPDFTVGSPDAPYLLRWWVIPRNRFFNIYLHCFCRSDDDRALHDHPYLFNCSVLLRGQYREWVLFDKTKHAHIARMSAGLPMPYAAATDRAAPAIAPRWGKSPHRIELTNGHCWTLFITGPRVREWGFYCPQGWKPWHKFTAPGKPGEMGPGCDDGN